MSVVKRVAAASLVVASLVATQLIPEEGFVRVAKPPVPGDRCTNGHGSTFHADGSPVQCGETITRSEAKELLITTVRNEYEAAINGCAGDIPMLVREKAILVRLAYQNGGEAVCGYSIVDLFRQGKYEEGCRTIVTIDKLQGRHCSRPENRNRKDGCNGLMNRRETQMQQCLGLIPMKGGRS